MTVGGVGFDLAAVTGEGIAKLLDRLLALHVGTDSANGKRGIEFIVVELSQLIERPPRDRQMRRMRRI